MPVSRTFQFKTYLSYWLDAVDEHSLHSPFFFDFYTQVVKAKHADNRTAESLRAKLLNDQRVIVVDDPGPVKEKIRKQKVCDIAARSLSSSKYSALYQRAIKKYNCTNVVELGTSLGVNTLYLAESATQVTTLEGSEAIAGLAELTFQFAGAENIRLIHGNINATLPDLIQKERKIDFAFIDANHTYKDTINYFNLLLKSIHEKSILVLDDIHYSAEMHRAWNEIARSPLVHGSADLYRAGFIFFDPSLNKQHVILQF